MSNLEHRISELERTVKVQKISVIAIILLAAFVSVVVFSAEDDDVLRASRFEVIAPNGEVHASLGSTPGHGLLTLVNSRGSKISIPPAIPADTTLDQVRKTEAVDKPKAIDLLDQAVFACGDPEILKHLLTKRGRIKRSLKDYEGCIADCTAAIQIDAELRYAWANRHHAWLATGNMVKANADLTVCKQLESKFESKEGR